MKVMMLKEITKQTKMKILGITRHSQILYHFVRTVWTGVHLIYLWLITNVHSSVMINIYIYIYWIAYHWTFYWRDWEKLTYFNCTEIDYIRVLVFIQNSVFSINLLEASISTDQLFADWQSLVSAGLWIDVRMKGYNSDKLSFNSKYTL